MSTTTRPRGRALAVFLGLWAGAIVSLMIAMVVISVRPARAGDLGGACCSDLEARVAELEAITADKGNRKVSLTISGQVSRAILFTDFGDGSSDHKFIDNTNDPSRITLSGSGKISPNVSVGFIFELGLGNAANLDSAIQLGTTGSNTNNDIMVRHAAVWMESGAGRVTMGKTSQATDNLDELVVSNTTIASRLLSFGPPSAIYAFNFDTPFDGNRRDLVRYDTPIMGGFRLSASWSDTNAYDVALRYVGEGAGFRVAAGAGYRMDDSYTNGGLVTIPVTFKTFLATGSVMHIASGLFVNGMYADSDFASGQLKGWHMQGGIEQKIVPIGKTTFYGEYGHLDDPSSVFIGSGNMVGGGIIQSLDNAAADVFVSYRNYQDGATQVVLSGFRVRF